MCGAGDGRDSRNEQVAVCSLSNAKPGKEEQLGEELTEGARGELYSQGVASPASQERWPGNTGLRCWVPGRPVKGAPGHGNSKGVDFLLMCMLQEFPLSFTR